MLIPEKFHFRISQILSLYITFLFLLFLWGIGYLDGWGFFVFLFLFFVFETGSHPVALAGLDGTPYVDLVGLELTCFYFLSARIIGTYPMPIFL